MTTDQEMRELADRATSGPWSADRYTEIDPDGAYDLARVLAPDPEEPNTAVLGVVHEGILIPDAQFIAACREWVPGALDRLQQVRTACERWAKCSDNPGAQAAGTAILTILDGEL